MPDQEKLIVGIVSAKSGSGRTSLALALAEHNPRGIAYWAPNGSYGPGLVASNASCYKDPIAALPAILASDASLVVVEADWDHAFVVARIADCVIVPTRLDIVAMHILHHVTIPLLVAAGTPAALYVVDETEGGRRPATDDELTHWWATAARFDSVAYAPWRPSVFLIPDDLGAVLNSATAVAATEDLSRPSCHLYRHLAADGTLLYVGISGDPIFRFRNGHKDKAWAYEVATVDVESFPTREMARTAELVAIAKERPLHNIADRPRAIPDEEDEEWDDDDDDEMVS